MRVLSADVGGTFTDLVLVDSATGALTVAKVPSEERGSAAPVLRGIRRILALAKLQTQDLDLFVHGFTVATNALLMRAGARAALIVSEGNRDILKIGNQLRPKLYGLTQSKPEPVIPRSRTFEVAERVDSFGHVVQSLEAREIEGVVAKIAALRPESCAICLNFAHLHPGHEQALKKALAARLPDIPVYLSSEVNPQIEEYPRANTTAVASYVGPIVDRYVRHLEADLESDGIGSPLRLMRSDGGVATPRAARLNPANTLLSGPAGGVIAGQHLGRQLGIDNLITFDMGGTSADFSAIVGGAPRKVRARTVDGQPLRIPMLDIETISAGGGSVGWVDRGGALCVGPYSAGAVPGPACYGQGGTKPTLTDAAVVLGLLDPQAYLGGDMTLNPDLARRSIQDEIAGKLDLSLEEAAYGMVAVANAKMTQAIRSLSVERGLDVRRFSLLAFGGAGPLYAPYLAESLQMTEVIAPRYPGVFAAQGLVQSDIRHSAQKPFWHAFADLDEREIGRTYEELSRGLDAELTADGIASDRRHFIFSADVRYIGQFHELEIPLQFEGPAGWWNAERVAGDFIAAHERLYGHADSDAPAEFVNLRVEAIGLLKLAAPTVSGGRTSHRPEPRRSRRVFFDRESGWRDCAIYRRDDLKEGAVIDGLAIIEQFDSTILVPTGARAEVGATSAVRLRRMQGDQE